MEDKKTPSSVGDIEAAEPASISGAAAHLSVRADTDNVAHSHTAVHHAHSGPLLQPSHMAHADHGLMPTIQPSALTVENVRESSPGALRLGPSEYAVTLPMDSRVKDDYERAITDGAADMRAFLASLDPGLELTTRQRDELLLKAQEVATRLNNVSFYPDLNVPEHIRFKYLEIEQEASWMEYSSSKFLFLKYWIDLTRDDDLHVILAVQDDIKQKIVERYLLGKGFTYTRPREELGLESEISMIKGKTSFGIRASDTAQETFKTPSAIFSLDASFDPTSHSVQRIRTTFSRNSGLLPIIWLLVANTCEHVGLCLPDLPQPGCLRLLLQETTRLHDEAGDLQDDALGIYENADEIRNYVLHSFVPWPLPSVEPLCLPAHEDDQESSTPLSEDRPSGAQKRSYREEDSEESSSKRARIDPQETTQSMISKTLPNQSLRDELRTLENHLADIKEAHSREKAAIQVELSHTKVQLEAQDEDARKALSSLQHRYETRTKDLHKIRYERDDLLEKLNTLEERLARHNDDMSKLKQERSALRQELEEARQELKNGGGTMASLESAREEVRRLTAQNSSLQRKADYSQSQSEYTREQYQTASTVAAQAGNEARQLREENEELTHKLAENCARLGEINFQNDSSRHLARIEQLEMSLAARDELLRKKEEELREIRKNRPSTRSTSAPRSPKWAAGSRPTSPGLNNNGNGNGNGNGLAGRGSALRFSSEMPL